MVLAELVLKCKRKKHVGFVGIGKSKDKDKTITLEKENASNVPLDEDTMNQAFVVTNPRNGYGKAYSGLVKEAKHT